MKKFPLSRKGEGRKDGGSAFSRLPFPLDRKGKENLYIRSIYTFSSLGKNSVIIDFFRLFPRKENYRLFPSLGKGKIFDIFHIGKRERKFFPSIFSLIFYLPDRHLPKIRRALLGDSALFFSYPQVFRHVLHSDFIINPAC